MSHAECRLGSLPDTVLHRIFSLLPTKHLVQISALSRRFRHLWKTSVDLSFSEAEFGPASAAEEAAESLSNFVESVLLLRDRSLDIHRFHLNCSSNWIQQKRLSTWIRFVAGANLRELDVCIPGGSDIPSNVFTCESLTELKVRMQYWEIRLPNPIKLSSLRILKITDVDFSEDEVKLGELISSCSVLVQFSLTRCYFRSLTIRADKLERLTFHHYYYNAVSVRLLTPRLRHLEHICEGTEDFVVGALPCLVEGSFDFRGYTWSGVADVVDILQGLSSAEVLTLNDFAITSVVSKAIFHDKVVFVRNYLMFPSNYLDLVEGLPVFHNLRNLKLINSLQRDICPSVKWLLECIPHLETLTIEEPVAYEMCPVSENEETLTREEPMIEAYEMYPVSKDKENYWKQMALPITYIDRIINVDVQHVTGSCGSMYYIVKFRFQNSSHWERTIDR